MGGRLIRDSPRRMFAFSSSYVKTVNHASCDHLQALLACPAENRSSYDKNIQGVICQLHMISTKQFETGSLVYHGYQKGMPLF